MSRRTQILLFVIWITLTMLGVFSNVLFFDDLSNSLPLIALGQAIVLITLFCIFKIDEKDRMLFYFALMFLLPGLLMFEFGIVLTMGEEYIRSMGIPIAINIIIFTSLYVVIVEKIIKSKK